MESRWRWALVTAIAPKLVLTDASGVDPLGVAASLAAYAYLSVVATALAFAAWFTGLRHLPAATVDLIGLLNPVAGVLVGVLLGQQRGRAAVTSAGPTPGAGR